MEDNKEMWKNIYPWGEMDYLRTLRSQSETAIREEEKNSSEFEILLAPKCQPPKNMVMMVGWRAIIVLTQVVLARLAS